MEKNNFTVVQHVSGQSTANYFFGIGGLSSADMTAAAYRDMLSKAKLEGTSRAIINVTQEKHVQFIFPPLYFAKTITVSGLVIEFTE